MCKYRLILALSVLVAGTLPLTPVHATPRAHADPNDTSGPLDIKRVEVALAHSPEGVQVEVSATTYQPWSLAAIQGAGIHLRGFAFQFDLNGAGSEYFNAVVRSEDGEPLVDVQRNGESIGTGTCSKTASSISCSFPRSWLRVAGQVRWSVMAIHGWDTDLAPNTGRYDGWHF
jgi:hypothetical protein